METIIISTSEGISSSGTRTSNSVAQHNGQLPVEITPLSSVAYSSEDGVVYETTPLPTFQRRTTPNGPSSGLNQLLTAPQLPTDQATVTMNQSMPTTPVVTSTSTHPSPTSSVVQTVSHDTLKLEEISSASNSTTVMRLVESFTSTSITTALARTSTSGRVDAEVGTETPISTTPYYTPNYAGSNFTTVLSTLTSNSINYTSTFSQLASSSPSLTSNMSGVNSMTQTESRNAVVVSSLTNSSTSNIKTSETKPSGSVLITTQFQSQTDLTSHQNTIVEIMTPVLDTSTVFGSNTNLSKISLPTQTMGPTAVSLNGTSVSLDSTSWNSSTWTPEITATRLSKASPLSTFDNTNALEVADTSTHTTLVASPDQQLNTLEMTSDLTKQGSSADTSQPSSTTAHQISSSSSSVQINLEAISTSTLNKSPSSLPTSTYTLTPQGTSDNTPHLPRQTSKSTEARSTSSIEASETVSYISVATTSVGSSKTAFRVTQSTEWTTVTNSTAGEFHGPNSAWIITHPVVVPLILAAIILGVLAFMLVILACVRWICIRLFMHNDSEDLIHLTAADFSRLPPYVRSQILRYRDPSINQDNPHISTLSLNPDQEPIFAPLHNQATFDQTFKGSTLMRQKFSVVGEGNWSRGITVPNADRVPPTQSQIFTEDFWKPRILSGGPRYMTRIAIPYISSFPERPPLRSGSRQNENSINKSVNDGLHLFEFSSKVPE